MSEFVIIARSILLLKYPLPEAKKSFNRHPGMSGFRYCKKNFCNLGNQKGSKLIQILESKDRTYNLK